MVFKQIPNMKKLFTATFFLSAILSVSAQQKSIITLASQDNAPTINKHIYGHFAEHLGRCIYDGFYVGENSKIPNTNGVRNDIIVALKDLGIPNLRWPGAVLQIPTTGKTV